MGVIINDFEVVVGPPAEPAAGEPTPAAASPPPALAPQDIVDVIRHQAERAARVRAH
jgi:hypothetical protein